MLKYRKPKTYVLVGAAVVCVMVAIGFGVGYRPKAETPRTGMAYYFTDQELKDMKDYIAYPDETIEYKDYSITLESYYFSDATKTGRFALYFQRKDRGTEGVGVFRGIYDTPGKVDISATIKGTNYPHSSMQKTDNGCYLYLECNLDKFDEGYENKVVLLGNKTEQVVASFSFKNTCPKLVFFDKAHNEYISVGPDAIYFYLQQDSVISEVNFSDFHNYKSVVIRYKDGTGYTFIKNGEVTINDYLMYQQNNYCTYSRLDYISIPNIKNIEVDGTILEPIHQ